jgi:outer membrane biosynthesis protein TonB
MKTLVISRNSKELVRVPLNRKSVLAGRSPSCDAVVRYKGMKPVQFLIEHVSENLEGEAVVPDFDSGFWTLIDVSENHPQEAQAGAGGAGIVIDESQQDFNGFEFKIVTDTLQETDLKKGVLSRSIDHTVKDTEKERNVVEVVYFRKDIDIVTNISHLNRKKTSKKIKLFPQQLPDFVFEWENGIDVKATIRSEMPQGKAEIFRRGERITADFVETKTIPIRNDDMIHIETANDDFYLRLVPEIDVKLEKLSWLRDYMLRALLGALALISMIVFLVKNFSSLPEEKIEPARIIKIEVAKPEPIKVEEPPPPEPPPPEEKVEVVKEQPKKEVNPEPVEKVKPQPKTDMALQKEPAKQPKPVAASAPKVVARPQEKPKAGLNNDSKPANVNTMGLLGKLKTGQKATTQKLSADQVLNQGVVSETMTGETGTVVVKKAPMGTIGRSKGQVDPNALAQASTTLSGVSKVDGASSGAIAMAGGKSRFSSGSQLTGLQGSGGAGAGNAAGTGTQSSGSGFDRGEAMSAVGGLDKDAIRKALRENRRAIANCYETALLTKRQLDGRMTFRWVISIEGAVTSIKLQNSEIAMPTFEACVESVIKSIKFPQSPNKSTTTVIYPFAFQGKK